MALSLKCGQCGVFLRSMKEAQDHGEVTGHSQFEESTEAILTLVSPGDVPRRLSGPVMFPALGSRCNPLRQRLQVCTECGKPCRSETEKDIHTKRTGHAHFSDKTNEAAKPIVSEHFAFTFSACSCLERL